MFRFGFVTFATEAAVENALKSKNSHFFDGKSLDVKHAFKRSDEEGGLPPVSKMAKFFTTAPSWKLESSPIKIFIGGISQVCVSTFLVGRNFRPRRNTHLQKYTSFGSRALLG